jgi:hypothetical protein
MTHFWEQRFNSKTTYCTGEEHPVITLVPIKLSSLEGGNHRILSDSSNLVAKTFRFI